MTADSYPPTSKESLMSAALSHSWAASGWRQTRSKLRSRRSIVVLGALFYFCALGLFLHWKEWSPFARQEEIPWASDATNFDSIFAREAALPQHNQLGPGREDVQYLRFSNQVWGSGWNNLLQERLLNTILAYQTDRAPVFSPFEAWAHPPRDDTTNDGQRTVLKIPYNALLSGPTSGMSWGPKDRHPRAVSQDYWDAVCPESERRIIDADVIMKQLGRDPDGMMLMTEWTKLIRSMPERCVEIKGTQTFDVYMIGSSRVLSLWDMFKDHPTVRLLEDSEVVKNAVSRNMDKLRTISWAGRTFGRKNDVIEGLLGVHIRRGDFRGDKGQENGHCHNLARWGSNYSGWNQLSQLPDKYIAMSREGVPHGDFSPEIKDYYLKHCLPTPEQIALRIREIEKETSTRFTHIFVASDAEDEFLVDLRRTLVADGWASDVITTSKDLELSWQAASVSNVVDMAILSRAEVFIGNGHDEQCRDETVNNRSVTPEYETLVECFSSEA